jgi:hypothetical protein
MIVVDGKCRQVKVRLCEVKTDCAEDCGTGEDKNSTALGLTTPEPDAGDSHTRRQTERSSRERDARRTPNTHDPGERDRDDRHCSIPSIRYA